MACARMCPFITRNTQLFPVLSDAYPVHYPAALCTWEVLLWLRCLFDSRAFHLKAKDGSLMPSLLPGADMFNYRFRFLFFASATLVHLAPSFADLSLQHSATCCSRHDHQERGLGPGRRR
jgi:hypothetical protein